jgi:hypothetical protein
LSSGNSSEWLGMTASPRSLNGLKSKSAQVEYLLHGASITCTILSMYRLIDFIQYCMSCWHKVQDEI